jgi:hypothetical protein
MRGTAGCPVFVVPRPGGTVPRRRGSIWVHGGRIAGRSSRCMVMSGCAIGIRTSPRLSGTPLPEKHAERGLARKPCLLSPSPVAFAGEGCPKGGVRSEHDAYARWSSTQRLSGSIRATHRCRAVRKMCSCEQNVHYRKFFERLIAHLHGADEGDSRRAVHWPLVLCLPAFSVVDW